jgi:hypothetical protein
VSLRATLWAFDDAPVEKPTETLVLIALADEATDEGRNAFPSVAKIAARARCKPRAAKYALRALEEAGLIRRGDQEIAARHIARADRRPTVYDLALEVTWASVGKPSPRGAQDAPRQERGAPQSANGVHSEDPRGARDDTDGVHGDAPDPSTNPTDDPTENPPGADAPTEREIETARDLDDNLLTGHRMEQVVNIVTKAWWDWAAEQEALPTQSFPACRTIVRTALKNGHPPKRVKSGLARLTRENRPVSGASLQIAMREGTATQTLRDDDLADEHRRWFDGEEKTG